MAENKRFRVTIGKNNSVALIDVVDNVRLMYIQFSNKEAAVSCRSSLVYQCELMNTFYEENEQLKQSMQRIFSLIDARIKAYEHPPFSAPVSNPVNPNYDSDVDRLARLSELQELRKEFEFDD